MDKREVAEIAESLRQWAAHSEIRQSWRLGDIFTIDWIIGVYLASNRLTEGVNGRFSIEQDANKRSEADRNER